MKQSENRIMALERVPWRGAVLVAFAVASAGCVRQVVSNRPGGGVASARAGRTVTVPAQHHQTTSTNRSTDGSVSAILNQQTQGAFNPFTDDAAVRQLEAQLRLDSHNFAARLELAGIYERYGLPEQAFDQYQRILTDTGVSPTSPPSSQRPVSEASNLSVAHVDPEAEAAAEGLARTARTVGRAADAIPFVAAFLDKSPSPRAWNELGMLYDEAGDLTLAERSYRQAAAIDPKLEELHDNLGYNLLLQNKLGQAESEFRRAIELDPKSVTAHNNLGITLTKLNDRDGAFGQFRLAASDDATAHNNLAVVLLEMGYLDKSRDELLQALTARYYFAPPMQNYKLVQELIEQRAQMLDAGDALPLTQPRISPALAVAAYRPEQNRVSSTVEAVRLSEQPEDGMEPKVPKDRQ